MIEETNKNLNYRENRLIIFDNLYSTLKSYQRLKDFIIEIIVESHLSEKFNSLYINNDFGTTIYIIGYVDNHFRCVENPLTKDIEGTIYLLPLQEFGVDFLLNFIDTNEDINHRVEYHKALCESLFIDMKKYDFVPFKDYKIFNKSEKERLYKFYTDKTESYFILELTSKNLVIINFKEISLTELIYYLNEIYLIFKNQILPITKGY